MHREDAPAGLPAARPVSGSSSTGSGSVSVGPASPPDTMNCPESSKSSSFRSMSFHSDDNSAALDDISHFEDIGLEDDPKPRHQQQHHHLHHHAGHAAGSDSRRRASATPRPSNPYGRSYSSERYGLGVTAAASSSPSLAGGAAAGPLSPPATRDLANVKGRSKIPDPGLSVHPRPALQTLQTDPRNFSTRSTSLNAREQQNHGGGGGRPFAQSRGGTASRSTTSLHLQGGRRHRSPSPNMSLVPRDPSMIMARSPQRRSSWQSNRSVTGGSDRKSIAELERECEDDEDDDDNIPDGFILDNVPMSPRPNAERPPSRSGSIAGSRPGSRGPSTERNPKERVRSVGNGTPAVAIAHGSLKSPTWKTDMPSPSASPGPPPDRAGATAAEQQQQLPPVIKGRAKSWNAGWTDLSAEARALTEKLEEHADEDVDGSAYYARGRKPEPRVRSALPDLPSLPHANMMMDAMPMSKEKEAVLGRTRPSWLPPKDPAEDKKHWKEYEKMMARSAESDRRREAEKMARSSDRDTTANGLMRIWDDDVLPRWTDAIRERRTRELWWRGVASRSRGVVWQRAIGNELGLTETSYRAALGRAQDAEARVRDGKGDAEDTRRDAAVARIRADVAERTWQDLRIFQAGGPLHRALVDVLSAYAMYRSDIGYVAGCNTVAALLLLNLPSPAATFIALANVLNRPLSLGFYAHDPGVKASAYNLVLQTLHVKSPNLHAHLTSTDADPDIYLSGIFAGLGTSHLAMDECARLWDVYVFEGDAVMVRAATAMLLRREMALLGTRSAEEVRSVLEDGATKKGKIALEGAESDEEKWMKWLREAGKA